MEVWDVLPVVNAARERHPRVHSAGFAPDN